MPYSCLLIGRAAASHSKVARDLGACGFRPFVASTPEAAIGLMGQWVFDSAVIDGDGFEPGCVDVLQRLRAHFRNPLILLARAQDESSQILGLESGATDVVVKPASTPLLAAKMRRLIEVSQAAAPRIDTVRFGPLAMDAQAGHATLDDVPLALTARQFDLLFLLASRAGTFVGRDAIALRLQGLPAPRGRSLDVHVYRIRQKLRGAGVAALRIDTVYGRGYMLSRAG